MPNDPHNWTKIGDHGAIQVKEGTGEEERDIVMLRNTPYPGCKERQIGLVQSEVRGLVQWLKNERPELWELCISDNPKTLLRGTPGNVFHMSDDQTVEATDEEMAQLLGDNFRNLTFGEQAAKVQDALKPFDQTFEYVPQAGYMRSNNHPTHIIAVWTSIRQTVKYILTTEPPKPKTTA